MNDRGHCTYIDVTVTHPTAPSHIRANPVPLQITAAREQHKIKKHKPAADKEGARFIPFAVESYGGIGEYAIRLVDQITASAVHAAVHRNSVFNPATIRRQLLLSVACAIQRGNAKVLEEGHVRCMRAASRSRLVACV